MGDLDDLRKRVNEIDEKIVEALAERRDLVAEIIARKDEKALDLRDRARESELLAHVIRAGRERGLDAYFVTKVYQEIVDYALKIQREHLLEKASGRKASEHIRVAFQGAEGAYSHLAARKHFASIVERISFTGAATFAEVIGLVEEGGAEFGFLPIENTTAGSINEVYDLLSRTNLSIVGEEVYEIRHCLMGIEEIPLAHIRRIYSHPQALAQCSDFLSTLVNCKVESYADTALAVRKVKEEQDLAQAAIASEEAAAQYGLVVLKRDIANQKENLTRFVVVARDPIAVDARIPCKTSLLLATAHREGALARCLNILAIYHLNMTKLESRPRPRTPWEYLFYIDFEGNIADEATRRAIEELKRETRYLKVLGSYPALAQDRTEPAPADLVAPPQGPGSAPRPAPAPTIIEKKGYRLASRAHKPEDTIVRAGGVEIGGERFVVIAGPCAVESEAQIRQCARAIRESGANILRGGCFKPRTSPYSFQGLGYEGLEYLSRAGRDFGMPVVTEVLAPGDVARVAEQADILQIGARNMQNFALLAEVGRIDRPVILKRGMMSSIDELLAAAEYILAQGNQQVILCERGIRTFETATRNTLDISAVPVLRERTHLPVLVDPSHAAGERSLVVPLALAARAAGAHGVMIEVHPEPETAASDGPQSLDFVGFRELMARLLGEGGGRRR